MIDDQRDQFRTEKQHIIDEKSEYEKCMHDLAKALTLSIDEDQSLQQKLKSQTTSLESVEKEAKNAVALKKIL